MKQRPGFTLLEVLLAMAMGILLLAAVYSAIGYQIRQAQAGRDLIDQATLARAILARISRDVTAAASLSDPARYRLQQQKQQSASGSGMGGSGMGGSGAGGSAMGAASTPGASGTGGASATGNSASGSGSSGSTSTVPPVIVPTGVVGDSSSLHVFVGRYPTEVWPANPSDQPPLTSDLRRVSYWHASDSNGGLCRKEFPVVTSQDALNLSIPTDEPAQYVMAPEVRSLEIGYFDGTNWNDTWDSTMLGPDNVTPVGSPRAISIKIGIPLPNQKNGEKLKYYKQIIAISDANGITVLSSGQVNQGGLTTTGPSIMNSTTGPGSATP